MHVGQGLALFAEMNGGIAVHVGQLLGAELGSELGFKLGTVHTCGVEHGVKRMMFQSFHRGDGLFSLFLQGPVFGQQGVEVYAHRVESLGLTGVADDGGVDVLEVEQELAEQIRQGLNRVVVLLNIGLQLVVDLA